MSTTSEFNSRILEIKTAIQNNIDILAREYTNRMGNSTGGYGETTLTIHNMCNKLVPGHAPNLYASIFLEVMCENHIATKTNNAPKLPTLMIVENINSTWMYHLRVVEETRSLCNSLVMFTRLPLKTWNSPPDHLPSAYCTECHRIAVEKGYVLNDPAVNTRLFTPSAPKTLKIKANTVKSKLKHHM